MQLPSETRCLIVGLSIYTLPFIGHISRDGSGETVQSRQSLGCSPLLLPKFHDFCWFILVRESIYHLITNTHPAEPEISAGKHLPFDNKHSFRLNPNVSLFGNIVDPDQLASDEAT